MRRFLTAIAPVLVVFALVGCESHGSGLRGPVEPDLRAASLLGSTYTVVEESTSYTGEASAVIGVEGGQLTFGAHLLRVPAGAVAVPTTFRISKTHPTHLRLKLTATHSAENDVGAAGFAKPVQLVLSYGSVLNIVDPLLFRVVWIRPDGSYELQTTSIDLLNLTASASLTHFSDYALATN